VPLAFQGRYFIIEPGSPDPLVSVIFDFQGKPLFEILKNEPVKNSITTVAKSPNGFITVADNKTGRFLFKVRPGAETSIVFGLIQGRTLKARIKDRIMIIGNATFENNTFNGCSAGVVVRDDGSMEIGAPIPDFLLK